MKYNVKLPIFSRGIDVVRQVSALNRDLPTIGIAGVTIPGAMDCMSKINQKCRKYFPQYEHPNILLHQLNFHPTHRAQNEGRWDIVEDRLVESITTLKKGGADFVVIPANTVHKVIDGIQRRSPIPVISILDAVADQCQQEQLHKIGIMGTRWTMADRLYQQSLLARGIKELIPSAEDQILIQQAIFSELIPTGSASKKTVMCLLEVVGRMQAMGCDGVALACTELPLVLNTKNCGMPALDTTAILAEAAVKKSLQMLTHA